MELTRLHSHLMKSWMVLGLVVSFAQVVRMFLEDCCQTVQVYNLIVVWMKELALHVMK